MIPVELATSSGLDKPWTAIIGIWLPKPTANPKRTSAPTYRAIDELMSRVYSKAMPAVIMTALISW